MDKLFTAGIVSEYNPFHRGHEWMIQQLRRQGVQAVVCFMSGNYVQRAEPALFPADVRAKAALAAGADLVIRLPVPWATRSAEGFALGSVGLAAGLGCLDVLAFGSETPDTGRLDEIAGLLLDTDFSAHLKKQLNKGISFATARAAAAELCLPGAGQILGTANNILGIEYCKALRKLRSNSVFQRSAFPKPLALPRKGAAHDGTPAQGFASASWLRQQVRLGGLEALSGWVPPSCLAIYSTAWEQGKAINQDRWQTALMARLKGKTKQQLASATGTGEGLENLLFAAIRESLTPEQVYDAVKSKRFAHSRIRRAALSAAMDFPPVLSDVPPFLHVLAASQTGWKILKQAKQTAQLPFSASLVKLEKTSAAAKEAAETEASAEDLYFYCLQTPAPGGGAYTNPVIVKPSF